MFAPSSPPFPCVGDEQPREKEIRRTDELERGEARRRGEYAKGDLIPVSGRRRRRIRHHEEREVQCGVEVWRAIQIDETRRVADKRRGGGQQIIHAKEGQNR